MAARFTPHVATIPAPGQPSLRLGGRAIPVVLPRWGDPRIRLGIVIISLQVLGQTVLRFKLSIAQILVSIAVCALVEAGITYWRQGALVWPASAILTGNSTAFILRANGTRPGDWWSLNGVEWFILAALIGILSKYVIRVGDRHVFNPSNLGLVAIFLLAGARHVFPQYLYWGPIGPPVILALVVIAAGAIWILRPLRMWPMVAAFAGAFAILIAIEAAVQRCFLATWHTGPVCGADSWLNLVLSPELLVFLFFMISDPKTAPRATDARILYGFLIALVAAGLVLVQPSEFGIKVAILGSLTVVCALVPFMERAFRGEGSTLHPNPPPKRGRDLSGGRDLRWLAVAIIAIAVPISVIRLSADPLVVAIDGRGSPPASFSSGPIPRDIPTQ
ncbi:MAG TPA: RnfABCDGE type electron transport complex subunit D [Candidatus Limnocylindrales bacterium]|nr:RnfABCDGE type electron transport complex subunit D [Candidatus Limnocylindrales bacterium]